MPTAPPTVCLIDTGLPAGAFASGVVAGGINLSGTGDPADIVSPVSRHGGDMAATILAHCPAARLVVLRVLDENGWLLDRQRLDMAFGWVVAQRAELGISVVCAALADDSHQADDGPYAGTPLQSAIAALRKAGVPTVAPAGNLYPRFCLAQPGGMAWPAILRDVVSVAALDPVTPSRLHPYSQRLPASTGSPCATTLHELPGAPGQTSGAAAVVAGRLAALRQAFPAASVDELLARAVRSPSGG